MTYFKYFTVHLIHFWVQHWTCNFKIWADLMTDNYKGIRFSKEDDPYQECCKDGSEGTINSDETLPKSILKNSYDRWENHRIPIIYLMGSVGRGQLRIITGS